MLRNRAEQQDFVHGNSMSLEMLARSLFGEKYFGSVNYSDMTYWKKFYVRCLDLIEISFFASVGSIDPSHRESISRLLSSARRNLVSARRKDTIHAALIVFLFKLVFLLMGRHPYYTRGNRRDFGTFRTLNYCQTEVQLSWLLQGAIQGSAKDIGFEDSFSADMAFHYWAKDNKRQLKDRSAYVEWVRLNFPEVYRKFSNS